MKRSLRVASYAVCVEAGKILLARWVGRTEKKWTLPGGGIDHGEDPLDAAVREVAEETGYAVRVDALLGIDSVHREFRERTGVRRALTKAGKATDWHGLRVVYAASVLGGELRYEENGSTDMAAWFDLTEVSTLDRTDLVDIGVDLATRKPPTGRADTTG
ncbi:NUDIX hydrolase [Actinokineospora cianjurensis]|uniref:ADP-ribose pyrophosphatase YjhB (NUDIX family) n=1 Tax=Actinokineospora cianjurensis TaxID=585224 RepID=A0A421B4Q4_9PSEU|nr:NUDIX hydrolase [Actinokineospora cianjurensis]RLK59305.1 ADP-ribose pyrophosphatase YjhB (NUDIX family) [Actinokineospora cianjurensis]